MPAQVAAASGAPNIVASAPALALSPAPAPAQAGLDPEFTLARNVLALALNLEFTLFRALPAEGQVEGAMPCQ